MYLVENNLTTCNQWKTTSPHVINGRKPHHMQSMEDNLTTCTQRKTTSQHVINGKQPHTCTQWKKPHHMYSMEKTSHVLNGRPPLHVYVSCILTTWTMTHNSIFPLSLDQLVATSGLYLVVSSVAF